VGLTEASRGLDMLKVGDKRRVCGLGDVGGRDTGEGGRSTSSILSV